MMHSSDTINPPLQKENSEISMTFSSMDSMKNIDLSDLLGKCDLLESRDAVMGSEEQIRGGSKYFPSEDSASPLTMSGTFASNNHLNSSVVSETGSEEKNVKRSASTSSGTCMTSFNAEKHIPLPTSASAFCGSDKKELAHDGQKAFGSYDLFQSNESTMSSLLRSPSLFLSSDSMKSSLLSTTENMKEEEDDSASVYFSSFSSTDDKNIRIEKDDVDMDGANEQNMKRSFSDAFQSMDSLPNVMVSWDDNKGKKQHDTFASETWKEEYRGNHVDVNYTPSMFPCGLIGSKNDTESNSGTRKTDWDGMFLEALYPEAEESSYESDESKIPSSRMDLASSDHFSYTCRAQEEQPTTTPCTPGVLHPCEELSVHDSLKYKGPEAKQNVRTKKPRNSNKNEKRKSNPKIRSEACGSKEAQENKKSKPKKSARNGNRKPETKAKKKSKKNSLPESDDGGKKYVEEPSDADVLLGRGGRSNHHKGNKIYRQHVEDIKPFYKNSSKVEKTSISQCLVDTIVENYNGRFLQMDEELDKWYIVTNIVARKKVSQALREDNTAEAREKKRQKYGKPPQEPNNKSRGVTQKRGKQSK